MRRDGGRERREADGGEGREWRQKFWHDQRRAEEFLWHFIPINIKTVGAEGSAVFTNQRPQPAASEEEVLEVFVEYIDIYFMF